MTHQLRGHLIWKGGQVLLCVIELLFSETKQFVPNPPIGSRPVKWPPLKEHYPGAPCRNGKIERKHVAKCRAPGGGAVLLNMVFLSDSWELTEARPGPSVGQASLSPLPPTLTPRFLGPRGGGPRAPPWPTLPTLLYHRSQRPVSVSWTTSVSNKATTVMQLRSLTLSPGDALSCSARPDGPSRVSAAGGPTGHSPHALNSSHHKCLSPASWTVAPSIALGRHTKATC